MKFIRLSSQNISSHNTQHIPKGSILLQASTLILEDTHYVINNPLQAWRGVRSQVQIREIAEQLAIMFKRHAEQSRQTDSTAQSLSTLGKLSQSSVSVFSSISESSWAHGMTVALESGMGVAPIIALYYAWQLWNQDALIQPTNTAQDGAKKMHLIVLEPYPLAALDAQRLFQELAATDDELQALAAQWPILLPGMHRIDIAQGHFTLTMLYAEQASWRQVMASVDGLVLSLPGLSKCVGLDDKGVEESADALDWGSKDHVPGLQKAQTAQPKGQAEREQVWQDLIRLTQPQAWALFAEQDGHLLKQSSARLHTQWYEIGGGELCLDESLSGWRVWQALSQRPPFIAAAQAGRQVCVIGAGLAGAGVARALAQRGWQVKVIDKAFTQREEGAHHGHLSAALTPMITVDDSHKARLSRAGTLRAHARWRSLGDQQGFNPCGTLELNRDKGHAKDILEAVEAMQFPTEWVRLVDAQQASELAGMPLNQHGAFFAYGLQVFPGRLIPQLLDHPLIECLAREVGQIQREEQASGYLLYDQHEQVIASAAQVVCATSYMTLDLLKRSGLDRKTLKSGQVVQAITRLESLHPMGGEVMQVDAQVLSGGPRCVVAGQGYLLPAAEGYCMMGGTYQHNQINPPVSAAGQEAILRKIPLDLDLDLERLRQSGQVKGWSGTRAVTQGRMPVIGPLEHAPGIFLACAYASHGLTWSSLAGDLIGAYLEGEPIPLERELWQSICPR